MGCQHRHTQREMIKRIRIKNFQSHKDTELEFHPGINVICGKSNSGKSAILRALKLLCENRPLGLHYKSHFAKPNDKVEVEIETFDNRIINLTKTKNKTTYILDGKEFTGSEVPDEIKSILNVSEINWQHQLDNHFLISESASEAAKIINKIIRIEDVDEWVSELTTEINSENKHIKILEGQKAQLEEAQNKYQHLEEAKSKLEEIEKLYDKEYNLETKVFIIQDKIEKLEKIKDIDRYKAEIEYIENITEEIERLQKRIDLYETFISIGDIEQEREIINKYEFIMQKSEEVYDLYKYSIDDYDQLYKYINDLDVLEKKHDEQKELKLTMQHNIIEIINEMNICPTCGTELDEGTKERIIDEICSTE
jgi:exonuclease SbcC